MNAPLFEVRGARVTRLEDYRLLTGEGKFAADWNLPGQLYGYFLRCDRAHARIAALNVSAARARPGVHAILTGEDAVRAGYVQPVSFFTFPGKNGAKALLTPWLVLAHERVRFAGEPVAFVVADTLHIAQDACALIDVAYEDLPCVVGGESALEAGAPRLHQHIPGNMPFECEAGDATAVAAAFAKAAHITRQRITSARVVPSPIEPRACLAAFDAASESYTIHACSQGTNMLRMQLSGYTSVPEDKLKIVTRDVGGGFGARSMGYPEYNKDQVALEVGRDGRVTVHSVPHSQGQGHETTLAMLVAHALEIPAERVIVCQGLNEPPLFGNHTGGSRNTVGPGTICHLTALKLIEQGKGVVAERLGVEPSQIAYAAGEFHCGEPRKSIALAELAGNTSFSIIGEGSFGATFPNDCHITEFEVDPETGQTAVMSYVTADDFGELVNETIVEGQLHGAVMQGAGQVFGEQALYDPHNGQLLTGSFLDYCMPRAGLIKHIAMNNRPTLSRVSPLGVKGMGEAGVTGALPALTNAVLNALRPLGVTHLDMPLTPCKIWAAITSTKS
jgi:CO/xanthine dehydrogenase Mo-binding subunit